METHGDQPKANDGESAGRPPGPLFQVHSYVAAAVRLRITAKNQFQIEPQSDFTVYVPAEKSLSPYFGKLFRSNCAEIFAEALHDWLPECRTFDWKALRNKVRRTSRDGLIIACAPHAPQEVSEQPSEEADVTRWLSAWEVWKKTGLTATDRLLCDWLLSPDDAGTLSIDRLALTTVRGTWQRRLVHALEGDNKQDYQQPAGRSKVATAPTRYDNDLKHNTLPRRKRRETAPFPSADDALRFLLAQFPDSTSAEHQALLLVKQAMVADLPKKANLQPITEGKPNAVGSKTMPVANSRPAELLRLALYGAPTERAPTIDRLNAVLTRLAHSKPKPKDKEAFVLELQAACKAWHLDLYFDGTRVQYISYLPGGDGKGQVLLRFEKAREGRKSHAPGAIPLLEARPAPS